MRTLSVGPLSSFFSRLRLRPSLVGTAATAGTLLLLNVHAGAAPQALTLETAIQGALAKNFAIKVEAFGPEIARANLLSAYGRFDPVISGSYDRNEDGNPQPTDPFNNTRPPSSIVETDTYDLSLQGVTPTGLSYRLGGSTQNQRGTFNAFADNYFTFAGISVTQPLLRNFGFGANLAEVRIARANKGISEWEYRAVVMDTITRVIFSYHDLYFAQRNFETARRSRDAAAGLLAENEKRFRVGSMSEADVIEARARVARREEAILLAERTVRDQENFLRQLVSDDRTPELLRTELTIAPPPSFPLITADPAADFPRALEKRPDYQQALLNVRRTQLNRGLQLNQLLPRLDLVGSYGYNGLDAEFRESRRQVEAGDNRSYSFGAVVSFPLTWAQERGRYRAAKLTAKQAETLLEQVEQDIVVRLGNAAGQLETTRQRVEVTRRSRALAQQNLDAEVKKLRTGAGSTFLVLQQQEVLSDAEIREFRATSDQQKALAEYDRQLGLTMDKYGVALAK